MKCFVLQIFVLTISAMGVSCKKKIEKPPVTIHCADLRTDIRPGDNVFVSAPTAFTPNGDGLNDGFRPVGVNAQSYSLKIYDENSEEVFQTVQLNATWTPTGVSKFKKFYYRINITTSNASCVEKCGEVYALKCFPNDIDRAHFFFEDQFNGNTYSEPTAENLPICN